MGQGVFPLYPVERTWILNEATEAKIRRKGFTIAAGAPPGPYCLLHYLREKFNTQAETPNGLCPRKVQERSLDGKHEDIPNGHCPETLNGLCPRKVQEKSSDDRHEGEPNGHCPESENSIEEAAEEYRKRVATYEARKTVRKHSGPQWHHNGISIPPGVYNVTTAEHHVTGAKE